MLSKRRPRAHIWIACGTQRGGANSDALAKFQFRNVGLLVLLIGNVHHFPFFLLLSVQTTQVCSFAPIPSLQDTGVPWARFMPYLDTQELRSESLALGEWTLGGLLWCLGMEPALSQHMLGSVHWLEASTQRCELTPISPLFLAWWESLLGFQQLGKAGVLQL